MYWYRWYEAGAWLGAIRSYQKEQYWWITWICHREKGCSVFHLSAWQEKTLYLNKAVPWPNDTFSHGTVLFICV